MGYACLFSVAGASSLVAVALFSLHVLPKPWRRVAEMFVLFLFALIGLLVALAFAVVSSLSGFSHGVGPG